jgi:hypothetical protein
MKTIRIDFHIIWDVPTQRSLGVLVSGNDETGHGWSWLSWNLQGPSPFGTDSGIIPPCRGTQEQEDLVLLGGASPVGRLRGAYYYGGTFFFGAMSGVALTHAGPKRSLRWSMAGHGWPKDNRPLTPEEIFQTVNGYCGVKTFPKVLGRLGNPGKPVM